MIQNKNIVNAGWIIGCKLVQAVLGVIISMLTARYLGPSQFGVINYAAAIVTFVTPIANLGLTNIIVQEIVCAPKYEGEILGSSIVLSFFSSIFCIVGILAFSTITNPDDKLTIGVCFLYSILLIAQSIELIQYWFQAKLMSKYPSIVAVIVYLIISIYKAILLIAKMEIGWFAISNAIDHLIIGVILLIIYQNKNDKKLKFSFIWAKRLFRKSKYFIVASMMVSIFAQTDKIMLKFMINDAATGIYSAASTCAGISSFVFVAIIDSMRPTILGYKDKCKQQYESNICRLYSVVICMALLQSLVMTLLAKPIIWILYGKEYFDAISVLRIVVWHTTFSYMGSIRNIWILAEEKQSFLWMINLTGAFANIFLNLIMIPLCGVEGAAVASVITQIFTNIITGYIIKPIRYNNVLILRSVYPKFLMNMMKNIISIK